MRFLATADWQLGMTAHYLDSEARPRFAAARLDAVRAIGVIAADSRVEFVVVAGDVFESNLLDRSIVLRIFEVLKSFTVPVYLLPGNHDPLDANSIYTSATFASHKPSHVHVLDGAERVSPVDGVEIVAAPWSNKRPGVDLVARAIGHLSSDAGVLRVVVGHGSVDTLDPDPSNPATISVTTMTRAIEDHTIDFVVLGDKHSTTEVAPGVWYPGTPEVTDRREPDPGHALIVDVSTDGAHVEKIDTGSWRFDTHEVQLTADGDIEDLSRWLDAQSNKERTALWLKISGTVTVTQKARLEEVLADHSLIFARLGLWERHTDLHVIPDDGDFAELGLTGFAGAAVDELREMASGDGEAGLEARDALALLVRLSGGVR